MSEAITRLNAALEGRYRIESEFAASRQHAVADQLRHRLARSGLHEIAPVMQNRRPGHPHQEWAGYSLGTPVADGLLSLAVGGVNGPSGCVCDQHNASDEGSFLPPRQHILNGPTDKRHTAYE